MKRSKANLILLCVFPIISSGKIKGSFLDFISHEYKIILRWECNKVAYDKGVLSYYSKKGTAYCAKPETYLPYNDEFNVMGLTQKNNADCHRQFYEVLFNPIKRLLEGNVVVKMSGEDIVKKCYYRKYFYKFRLLPKCIRAAVFDAGVLSGKHRAVRFLQKSVGTRADQVLGPETLRAAHSLSGSGLLNAYHKNFTSYLKRTKVRLKGEKPKSLWKKYKNGWSNRIDFVREMSLPYCKEAL